jgi:hypothetical protein
MPLNSEDEEDLMDDDFVETPPYSKRWYKAQEAKLGAQKAMRKLSKMEHPLKLPQSIPERREDSPVVYRPWKRGEKIPDDATVYFKKYPDMPKASYTEITTNMVKKKRGNFPKDADTISDYPHYIVSDKVLDSLYVSSTHSLRGWGLFTNSFIRKNVCLGEYVGEVSTEKQSFTSNYRVILENGNFIDANMYGNCLRFINSSCHPNAEYSEIARDGILHVYVVSIRDIEPSEEILCRYYDHHMKVICDCNNPCNNPLFSDDVMSNYELILQQPPKTYFVPNYIFVIT